MRNGGHHSFLEMRLKPLNLTVHQVVDVFNDNHLGSFIVELYLFHYNFDEDLLLEHFLVLKIARDYALQPHGIV